MIMAVPIEGPVPASMTAVAQTDDFSAVFREHHAPAVRLAFLLCGDQQWAEDAVAEAFAATYVQLGRGRVDDVGAYLRRAVVNQVRGGIRRRVVERRYAARLVPPARSGSFEEGAADRDAIWVALRRLPTRQRAAVVLRYYVDLSEAEAAAALGCSLPAVKSLSSRGLQAMRALLVEGGEQ